MINLKERTLVLIKPDGVKRALIGKIISRFEDAGFTIIGMKLIKPSKELARQHYSCDSMQRKQMGMKASNTLQENHVDPYNVFRTHDVELIGDKILDWNIEYLSSGPVLAVAIEGFEAVTKIRDICGRGHPLKSNIGTIRGDFSSVSSTISAMYGKATPNLVHASDNSNDKSVPEREINLWFCDDELIAYENIHDYILR